MKFLLPALAALALGVPAFAQDAAKPADEAEGKDPNRMICKTEKVSGTRLSSKKVCMTAAQWAQAKRDQRETVDKVQANRPLDGG